MTTCLLEGYIEPCTMPACIPHAASLCQNPSGHAQHQLTTQDAAADGFAQPPQCLEDHSSRPSSPLAACTPRAEAVTPETQRKMRKKPTGVRRADAEAALVPAPDPPGAAQRPHRDWDPTGDLWGPGNPHPRELAGRGNPAQLHALHRLPGPASASCLPAGEAWSVDRTQQNCRSRSCRAWHAEY